MSWLLLTLIGALVFSSNNLLIRVLMKDDKSDPYVQTVVMYGLAGAFALLFSLFHGGFHYRITFNQFLLFIPLAISITVGPILLFKSFQLIDASENTIVQSSQKLWAVLGAFVFLHEPFSIKKIIGTITIILGIAIALWKQKKFQLNKGVILILISMIFYTSADLIAFFLVRNFDPISLIIYVCFLPVATLLLIKPKTIKKISFYFKPKYALCISILSFNDTLGTLCIYFAYLAGRNIAQIAPIMGSTTIISVLLAIVFLKERSNLLNKIIGALVVVGGVLLVL